MYSHFIFLKLSAGLVLDSIIIRYEMLLGMNECYNIDIENYLRDQGSTFPPSIVFFLK